MNRKQLCFMLLSLMALKGYSQTPKYYYGFNNSLAENSSGPTLTTKFGTVAWTNAPKSGNGTHAIKFDGNTMVNGGIRIDTSVKALTVSCWVNNKVYENQILFGQYYTKYPLPQQPSLSVNLGTFRLGLSHNTLTNSMYPYFTMNFENVSENAGAYNLEDSLTAGWHHLTATWENTGANDILALYIDGRKIDITGGGYGPKRFSYNDAGINLVVGGQFDFRVQSSGPPQESIREGFKGELDEIKIFESRLDDAQIQALYSGSVSKINGMETNTVTQLYPNPICNQFFIYSNEDIKTVRITGINGTVVYEGSYNQGQPVEIGQLTAGIYFVNLIAGSKTITQKIVKQ